MASNYNLVYQGSSFLVYSVLVVIGLWNLMGLFYLGFNMLITNERESIGTIMDESCEVASPDNVISKQAGYGRACSLSDIFDVLPGAVVSVYNDSPQTQPLMSRVKRN